MSWRGWIVRNDGSGVWGLGSGKLLPQTRDPRPQTLASRCLAIQLADDVQQFFHAVPARVAGENRPPAAVRQGTGRGRLVQQRREVRAHLGAVSSHEEVLTRREQSFHV